jgi:hypothetical protein
MKFEPKEHLFGYNPDTQILVWMKPSEFLDKTPKLGPEHWESPSICIIVNELAHKMENGIPIDPLFLDIDTINCKVTNHEGRHRAMAAEKAGIARVPVIVYLMDNNKDRISTKEYLKNGCKCNYFDAQKQE